MNLIAEQQTLRNRESRNAWSRFADHRQRVTQLVLDSGKLGGKLCVLGAGNCNDLDLDALAHGFDEMHLVDLDSMALSFAIEQQSECLSHTSVVLHGDVDVTAVLDQLEAWDEVEAVTDDAIDACLQQATQPVRQLPTGCDVTISICLLTQIIECVAKSLGEDHPRFLEVVAGLRTAHLQRLLTQTASGGRTLLITDLVSTDTAPQLREASGHTLPSVLAQLLQDKNFFTGLNPGVIHALLSQELAGLAHHVQIHAPWLWDLGPRMYAVYAASAQRR